MTDLTDDMTAVVFDFYGTLTPVSPTQTLASNAARLASVMDVGAQELQQLLDDSFGERITGQLGDVRQTMATLAARLGVTLTPQQLDLAVATRRERQEAMFALRPEAEHVIRQLRARGLRIGLVSDCTPELPEAWPRLAVSALVDAAVFSCVERVRKPDPRLFRAVAERLPADPEACLYVGDGGGCELTGASAVGMHAVLLAGSDWHASRASTREKREAGWTGARIGSLTELCR